MRLIDAEILVSVLAEIVSEDHKELRENILKMINDQPTVRSAIYVSDAGFYDECTNGRPYYYVEDPERSEGLIVLNNDCGGNSRLLKEKFRG